MSELLSSWVGIVIILFLFALSVLWFFLPFAIFGIKDKLNALILESKKTNEHLSALRSQNESEK